MSDYVGQRRITMSCSLLCALLLLFPVDGESARTLDCHKPNEYRLVVVENPSRKKVSDPVTPEDVNIVVGDNVIAKIELPKESEAKNFLLDSMEKGKAGFEIKVNWGGGVYHYEVEFNFRCKGNGFFLYSVKKVSYSTRNPDSGSFLDRQKTKVLRIQPTLPVTKFVMTRYL